MEAKDWVTSIITILSIIVSTFVTRQGFKKSVALSKSDLRIEGLQSALTDYTYQFFVESKMYNDPKHIERMRGAYQKILVYGTEKSVDTLAKYRVFSKDHVKNIENGEDKQIAIDCFLALLVSELKYDVVDESDDPINYILIKRPTISKVDLDKYRKTIAELREKYLLDNEFMA